MATKFAVIIILSCIFFSSFLLATALFDTLDKENGYYTDGLRESRTFNE